MHAGKIRKGQGASDMLDSHLHLSWGRYFSKLLKLIDSIVCARS